MQFFEKLLETDPFDFSNSNKECFLESFRETAEHHYKNNSFIKWKWDALNLLPQDIKTEEDLLKAPFVMVNVFKHHELISVSKEEIVLTLGSSGTSGQRSLIHLDENSLSNVKRLAYKIHQGLGITSEKKYNYLCFAYDPAQASDVGTAFTDELLTSFTHKNEVYYAIKWDGEKFFFDEQGVVKKLEEFSSSPYSTRILGFPAHLYHILEKYRIQLDLGRDSWVQTGGGWKADADKEISKGLFREKLKSTLGVPVENIRDMFGMVEHGIPYVDCSQGFLRVPNYARVIIRDAKTLAPLSYGETGLIQFICTYNTSYPSMNLLASDWGRLERGEDGKGDKLFILGRAGIQKHKGCAIQAGQMIGV